MSLPSTPDIKIKEEEPVEVDSSPPDSPASNPRSPQTKEKVCPARSLGGLRRAERSRAQQSFPPPPLGTAGAHLVCERERNASSLPTTLPTHLNLHVEVKRTFLPIPGMGMKCSSAASPPGWAAGGQSRRGAARIIEPWDGWVGKALTGCS